MPPVRTLPSDAAGQNPSVGTLSFVAGAADAKIRLWRIKHRRLQTAAEVFSPALYIRARVV